MRRVAPLLGLLLLLSACAQTPVPPPTPMPPPTATPAPEAKRPAVYTDWSKLDKPETAVEVGTRWYEAYTDRLFPGDYGGELVAFAGLRVADDWPAREGGGCLYGLMTRSGTVVVDPVYSSVTRLNCGSWRQLEAKELFPVLALGKSVVTTDGEYRRAEQHYAFAAADGSWCTDFVYDLYATGSRGVFASADSGCILLDQTGAEQRSWSWAELGYSEERRPTFNNMDMTYIEWIDAFILLEENEEQARVLNVDTGLVETLEDRVWQARREAAWEGGDYDETLRFDPYTAEPYVLEGDRFNGPLVLRDEAGAELARIETPDWTSSLGLVDGMVEVIETDTATYMEKDGTVVLRRMLRLGEE